MKKILTYLLFVFFNCWLIGCEKLVSVDPPKNQVASKRVFEKDDQALAAMTGIYSRMYMTGGCTYRIPLSCGLAGDELINWSSDPFLAQVYQNGIDPTNSITNDFWNNGFNIIYQANAVIEGCEGSLTLSQNIKKQIEAEAYFLRAFWYFYLVNFYGEVPVLISTDYKSNAIASKRKISEVYEQIKSDLDYASKNLNTGYVDSRGAVYDQRLRPNKYTALALLSRVYLYMNDWENAITTSSEIINESVLYDTVSIEKVFLKNNKEAIWQILNPGTTSDKSTVEGRSFALTKKPLVSGSNNCTSLSNSLISIFESGDKRKSQWVGSFEDLSTTPSTSYYYPSKYKEILSPNPNEYSTIFRLSEQYLIRAEAYARKLQFDLALKDLNLIRKRAGLDSVFAIDLNEFMRFLIKERQVELFAEWGHRWLDIKRWQKVDEIMQQVTPIKGGIWNVNMQLWPIPQRDIESNPNLRQNIGYN